MATEGKLLINKQKQFLKNPKTQKYLKHSSFVDKDYFWISVKDLKGGNTFFELNIRADGFKMCNLNRPNIPFYGMDQSTAPVTHSKYYKLVFYLDNGYDKVYLRRKTDRTTPFENDIEDTNVGVSSFFCNEYINSASGLTEVFYPQKFEIKIGGNIMSLIYVDFEDKTTLPCNNIFSRMFAGCDWLLSAQDLKLPAMTLKYNCYKNMFSGCTKLRSIPELPATSLTTNCYYEMFARCKNLRYPQRILPATDLSGYCYYGMFRNCTSLVTVPKLPATKLMKSCYGSMFSNCTSLTTLPSDLLPAGIIYEGSYSSMFYNCSSLTTVPKLPAIVMNGNMGYYTMFFNCSSITSATLSLTQFGKGVTSGCKSMFGNCTKLSNVSIAFKSFTDMNNQKNTNLSNWLKGVASSGIMKVPNTYAWNTESFIYSVDGIPSGWTVNPVL